MEIIGYSDRWSVRGGDTVSVHVSLARAGPFRAQLLRLVGGSRSPAGFGVRYEPAGVSGVYAGAPQTTVAGSYGRVPAAEPLFSLHRFSLCVRFCPTMPAGGKQTLVCALDETSGRGFRLSLEGAALCLEVGDGSGVVRAIAGQRRANPADGMKRG